MRLQGPVVATATHILTALKSGEVPKECLRRIPPQESARGVEQAYTGWPMTRLEMTK